ncbi:capsular polysaccharide biosynthesis protein CapF [Marinobacter sp.]|uniref:UDP-2-acetamido-2,6-beta-L-arabino-hexul-4-ose reductase n=1 Tax=Marinobacter sp. TaxID=50741 RepID=UPI000C9495ED|nr:capsular polysaccharide biosynthesis protein CapF [Marinobacter sp.]MAC23640.1 capsular biosynthesis protein [Marinobacter sp.]|tara:strand:- start:6575 stop:7693 length:1119 start_codon:yes stop_codon:yes gene_type:complete
MKVLVTGADGFIGKNLQLHLEEKKGFEVVPFTREHNEQDLAGLLCGVDWIVHLAGINRPQDPSEFRIGNAGLTQVLCDAVEATGRIVPIIYSSSIQAERDNEYGSSKREAEDALLALNKANGNPVYIYRLPNVFGKWARPNYNSAVATFCHNIARDLPVQINDPDAMVNLVYVDDVIASFLRVLEGEAQSTPFVGVEPVYQITVGELASQLYRFKATRDNLITERVGSGLVRALYSTYVSYLPPESFTYTVPQHGDERGVFVEMLKTPDAGQFSFFTAHPGVTRGGHYHHSKTEKFLVIKGQACFRFRHMISGEFYELHTSGARPEIVETVPGWTHDITNIGEDELVCMLWANEIFDRDSPDTFACPVGTEA